MLIAYWCIIIIIIALPVISAYTSWNYAIKYLIIIPIIILLILLKIFITIGTLILIYTFIPLLFIALLYLLSLELAHSLSDVALKFGFGSTDEIVVYLTIVIWSSAYAHLPFFRQAYIYMLNKLKKTIAVKLTSPLFDRQIIKLRNKSLSIHVYTFLLIALVSDNLFNFSYAQFDATSINISIGKVITEALLTFVVIDTIINKRKQLKKDIS